MSSPAADPLYPQAALGYRVFRVNEDRNRLLSMVARFPWERVSTASCITEWRHPDDSSPCEECECGLYAYHSLDHAAAHYLHWKKCVLQLEERAAETPILIAAVLGRGEALVHAHGWRVAQAQVAAIYDPSGWLEGDRSKLSARELAAIAEFYGAIRAREFEQLREIGERNAQPLCSQAPRIIELLSEERVRQINTRYGSAKNAIDLQLLSDELCLRFPEDGASSALHMASVLQVSALSGARSWRVLRDESLGDYSYARALARLRL